MSANIFISRVHLACSPSANTGISKPRERQMWPLVSLVDAPKLFRPFVLFRSSFLSIRSCFHCCFTFFISECDVFFFSSQLYAVPNHLGRFRFSRVGGRQSRAWSHFFHHLRVLCVLCTSQYVFGHHQRHLCWSQVQHRFAKERVRDRRLFQEGNFCGFLSSSVIQLVFQSSWNTSSLFMRLSFTRIKASDDN